ncbi:hypothetical protein HNP46_000264 [Pseudomonas nitritireducens]|uniref:Uncharacterized protein n=1 Tax=Pseudomonas nitroreducens TaxID=46680 RepID=A0A7W7KG19_PSENT|nr:hypothetical protein [Pseudomonas nitritireducens]MBB4861453.1 hypothetical protein [Pseudomonas nitritireducens]
MAKANLNVLETVLAKKAKHLEPGETPYAVVETGAQALFHGSTIPAAQRRGYRVEQAGENIFHVYPKGR